MSFRAAPTSPPPCSPILPACHSRRTLFVALGLTACGTSGGNQAAQLAGDVISGALSAPDHDTPSAFSATRGGCELFSEYAMACPVLPNCRALFGTQDVATYNACDDDGRLRPITVCKGWQGSEHWCAAGKFPDCEKYQERTCTRYETLVCQDPKEQRHVLRCQDDRYAEPERRSVSPRDTEEVAAMPKECDDALWTSLCQRVLDLEDLQPYLHPEVSGRVPLKLAKGSPCDGRSLTKHEKPVELVDAGTKGALVITRLTCAPPAAEMELTYEVEGVTATATFELRKGGWQVDSRRVVEH